MAAAFSFGSVGDIIALCQIAVELGRALSDSRGSAKEYQDLQQEIFHFVNTLGQVISTCQQFESSPHMISLGNAVKDVVEQCTSMLELARDSWIDRYGSYLKKDGCRSWAKTTYGKIRWTWEKEDVDKFREKLRTHTLRLTLLTSLTATRSARVDNETLTLRIKEVDEAIRLRDEHLLEKISAQNRALEELSLSFQRRTTSIVKFLWFIYQSILDVKRMVERNKCLILEQQLNNAPVSILYALDPTRGQGVVLENALGEINELPWDMLHSWKDFNDLVAHQFESHSGYWMVRRLEYTLEETCSGKRINRNFPLKSAVRRGMRLEMNMIFRDFDLMNSCPRCNTWAETKHDVLVQCQRTDCRMWFRVAKYNNDSTPLMPALSPLYLGTEDRIIEEIENDEIEKHGREIDGSMLGNPEPSDFQRVSLFSSKPDYSFQFKPADFSVPVATISKRWGTGIYKDRSCQFCGGYTLVSHYCQTGMEHIGEYDGFSSDPWDMYGQSQWQNRSERVTCDGCGKLSIIGPQFGRLEDYRMERNMIGGLSYKM